ncbi:MAG: putative GTP-binding protein YjiA [Methanomassiliicoccales archaeon PtaU1.Bin124]|nr:MAG: putative GTP-binding protein YjiA [Methanomassiliicoccales archaeon PtaU1.Bin124]
MDMLVISGFLGSGKTTLILSTVGKLIETTKKKVVIIVNDFGQIGIDGKVMEKYGLAVTEMPSGCICCTLGSDFLETVRTVDSKFKPDLIIVEPTGIADPANILDTMKLYHGPIGTIRILVVVDSVRFPLIMKALAKPLRNQLNAANAIIINKVDEASPQAVKEVKDSLEQMGIKCPVVTTSATAGINLEDAVKVMVSP